VLLENCHLSVGFLAELGRLVETLKNGAHPGFRVSLTASRGGKLPKEFLQNAVKIAVEPTSGIKKNLVRVLKQAEKSFDRV
jgi:hypothetical protein